MFYSPPRIPAYYSENLSDLIRRMISRDKHARPTANELIATKVFQAGVAAQIKSMRLNREHKDCIALGCNNPLKL